MSDVGLGATLQLEIAEALARIDQISTALATATTGVPVTLADPDASGVTVAIDQAVDASDTTVVPEAEAGGVTSSIDAAVDAADPTIVAEADASGVTPAIDAAVEAVDATVPVDADTTLATDALGALVDAAESAGATIAVDADTSGVSEAISAVVDDAAGQEIILDVTADTGDATEQIGAVGEAAAGAAAPVEELSTATAGLTGATQDASGGAASLSGTLGGLANISTATSKSAAGLGTVVKNIAPSTQAAVGGVVALVAVTKEFFSAALDAQVSADRFNTTLGTYADQVRHIDVGNLSGQISTLSAELGTSDEALQDAASKIFSFGESSGVAAPKVAETTEQILALSLRARALKPELGESGAIAEQMATAFARGGRALIPFGISLTAAQIEARALADTGKAAAADLTIFEKSAAGAALATEQFGGSLDEALKAGGENPVIRIAALKNEFGELTEELGKPLVVPVIDLLEALAPLGLILTQTLGTLVQALIPVLDLIGLFGGILTDLFEGLESIGPGASTAAVGVIAFGLALSGVLTPAGVLIAAVVGISAAIQSVRTLFGSSGPSKFAKEVQEASDALRDQQGVLQTSVAAIANYITTTARFSSKNQTDDIERLGLTIEQVAEFAKAGAAGIDDFRDAVLRSGESGKNMVDLLISFDELQRATQEAAEGALALEVAQGTVDQSFLDSATATGDYVTALEDGRQAADDAAEAALSLQLATGELTRAEYDQAIASTTAAGGAADYSNALAFVNEQATLAAENQERLNAQTDALASRLPELGAALRASGDDGAWLDLNLTHLATALTGSAVTAGDFDVVAANLGVTTDQLTAFVQAMTASLDDFTSTAIGTLPSVGDAFDNAAAKAKEAEEPLSAKGILAALQENVKAVQQEMENLQLLVDSGFTSLAGLASQKGPEFVKAFADAIRSGDTETLDAFQHTLLTANVAGDDLQKLLHEKIGPEFLAWSGETGRDATTAFGEGFVLTNAVTGQLASVGEIISGGQPIFAAHTAIFGKGGADSLVKEFGAITPGALAAITATGNAVTGASGILSTATRNVGTAARGALTDKLDEIPSAASGVMGRTRDAVVNANVALVAAATASGEATGGGFGSGFLGRAVEGTQKGGNAARVALAAESVIAAVHAVGRGETVGSSFGHGLAAGIGSSDSIRAIRNAAAAAVREAESAARAEARSHSPSLLFAELGLDLMRGVEAGIVEGTTATASAAADAVATANLAASLRLADQFDVAGQAATEAAQSDLASQLDFLNRQDQPTVGQGMNGFVDDTALLAPQVQLIMENLTITSDDPAAAREAGREFANSAMDTITQKRLLTVAIRQQQGA